RARALPRSRRRRARTPAPPLPRRAPARPPLPRPERAARARGLARRRRRGSRSLLHSTSYLLLTLQVRLQRGLGAGRDRERVLDPLDEAADECLPLDVERGAAEDLDRDLALELLDPLLRRLLQGRPGGVLRECGQLALDDRQAAALGVGEPASRTHSASLRRPGWRRRRTGSSSAPSPLRGSSSPRSRASWHRRRAARS